MSQIFIAKLCLHVPLVTTSYRSPSLLVSLPSQVCEHLQAVGKVCGVRVAAIVGGLAQVKQQRVLASKPAVVVATPGRLWDLMREGQAFLTDLSHLSFLILDEADKMVQQGHFQVRGRAGGMRKISCHEIRPNVSWWHVP